MEFADKYELLEPVTTGAVESFIGNNRTRGERVLVHILQCEPQKPNQPTVQWVLDAFRKRAPDPVGMVLETGRYSGTTYAYVITTLPENAELADWVARYNNQTKDTQEFATPAAEPSNEAKAPAAQAPAATPQPAQVPVQFTQIFRELDGGKSAVSTPSAPRPSAASGDLPPSPMPSFDEEHFRSGVHAAPQWNELSKAPANENVKLAGAISNSSADSAAKSFPADAVQPANENLAKPGEFTGFWQGPFRVDGPAESPLQFSSVAPQNQPSEFTMMFRPGSAVPETPVISPPAPEQNAPRSGLTGWATHAEIMAQEQAPEPPLPAAVNPTGAQAPPPVVSSPAKPSSLTAQPATPPRVPAAVEPRVFPVPTPPRVASPPDPPVADAASAVFQSPLKNANPAAEPVPAGPSPYTQIISMKRPAADSTGAEVAAALNPPSFASSSKPAMPAPQLPKLPPVPKLAPPVLKAPKLNAPKLDMAKPPVSYWPLVLTLTALFFIAVLLVLYFVLRH